MGLQDFKDRFRYDREKVFNIGVERECFLADQSGVIGPYAHRVLTRIGDGFGAHQEELEPDAFGYELSGCQLEMRAGPCAIDDLRARLVKRDRQLACVLKEEGLLAVHTEVAPEDMPLDVYPDPTGRYAQMVKAMPVEILRAACRVAGTHVHVGMRDHDHALRVYNHARKYAAALSRLGDRSDGKRLQIYREMAPFLEPKHYASWDEYQREARERGFEEDPRKCWTLVRISVHGTIEFRMFGATESVDCIVSWANECREICRSAPCS